MIGVRKHVTIVAVGPAAIVMFNPVIVTRDMPFKTEEDCLSLTGVRKTTRYQNIEVEYIDSAWKPHRQKYTGWTAQIIHHEVDHLDGIII